MIENGVLADWHQRATVRNAPRRIVDAASFSGGDQCFPAELAPWVDHPLVAALGPDVRRAALTRHLFLYLDFTDRLEHEAVNQTVRRIATGASGLPCSAQTRMDAYKIYCDEAYHSLFSADLANQIHALTGHPLITGAKHPAFDLFHSLGDTLPPERRNWFELMFVTVSETLVSGSLERIPRAAGVLPAVRDVVADHLRDEVRHHGFFSKFFRSFWPRMGEPDQVEAGRLLPRFILAFLSPAFDEIGEFLSVHLTPPQVRAVLSESYPDDVRVAGSRSASAHLRSLLRLSGVFDKRAIADAFQEAGLEPAAIPACSQK